MCFLQTCPDRLWSCRVQPRSPLPPGWTEELEHVSDLSEARRSQESHCSGTSCQVEDRMSSRGRYTWSLQSFLNPPAARIGLGFIQQHKGKWLINVSATGRKLEVMKEAGWTGCDHTIRPDSAPLFDWCVLPPWFFLAFMHHLQQQNSSKAAFKNSDFRRRIFFYVAAVSRPHQLTSQPWLADTALSQACMRNSLLVLIKFMFVKLFAFFFVFETGALMQQSTNLFVFVFCLCTCCPCLPPLFHQSPLVVSTVELKYP